MDIISTSVQICPYMNERRVVAIVHIEREDCTRIISVRKATKYEQRGYFEQFSD